MKKIGIILLVFLIIGAAVIWHFRFDIFQYSAESIIMNMLPEYVHVKRIIFDLPNGVMRVQGFGIKNPRGYEAKFLASVESITCRYKMRGKNILDGIEVTSIKASEPVINIERLSNGRLNVEDMGQVMEAAAPAKKEPKPSAVKKKTKGKDLSDIIKMTDTVNISDGKIVFLDRAVMRRPYQLTFEDVNGDIVLGLSDDYRQVLSVGSKGNGFVNGDHRQKVGWIISLDPQARGLTMENRFDVSDVDVMPFKPYYDQYSPIDVRSGRFSGTLIFNFDNGNIGSTNTVYLDALKFTEKKKGFASGFWDTTLSDIIKYLESSPGRIIFDFKIKGPMDNPRFYLGPHVKKALQNMVIDKVADLLRPEEGDEGAAPGAPKSDTEKVVDLIQGILKQ